MYFRDKLWRWIDSDLRKNEINSSYFERKWFSKNENDTRVEIFPTNYHGNTDQPRPERLEPFRSRRD